MKLSFFGGVGGDGVEGRTNVMPYKIFRDNREVGQQMLEMLTCP